MQVLLKWNTQRGVPVIPKASSPAHMISNLKGLFEWRLTYEQKVRHLLRMPPQNAVRLSVHRHDFDEQLFYFSEWNSHILLN